MANERGKNNPKPGGLAIVERTLERFPWSRLSDDKGDQAQISIPDGLMGGAEREWLVTPKTGPRVPGPFAADLYVALCQLYNAANRPDNRTVETTFRHLAALMHRPVGGGFFEAVTSSLVQLTDVTIVARHLWAEGERKARLKIFHLLDSVEVDYIANGMTETTVARVRFSEEVAESIANGHVRLLDTAAYFALETPTARRLFRYLDRRRWRGPERLSALCLPLHQLAAEIPIDRASPSHIKRTLDPAHVHLIERGFLSAATYEDRPVPGRKRGEIWVAYTFADPLTPAVPPAVAPPAAPDAAYLRERVTEIVRMLDDEPSTAFYVKTVKALPEPMLRGLVGSIRQSITEGVPVEIARKMFTTSAKVRAKALGVEL